MKSKRVSWHAGVYSPIVKRPTPKRGSCWSCEKVTTSECSGCKYWYCPTCQLRDDGDICIVCYAQLIHIKNIEETASN